MRYRWSILVCGGVWCWIGGGLAPGAAHAGPPVTGEMRLRRAVLTLGGVGTFDYEATVGAGGIATLDVRRGDLDDVLASLTVRGGDTRLRGLRLPGPDSTAAAFARLPFSARALADPLALLNGLRGVALEVRDPSGRDVVLSGRLLSATREREPAGATRDGLGRTRVTLLTDAGLRQFVLEEAGAVRVADPALQSAIDSAVAALRGQADGDRVRIALETTASVGQTVRVEVVTAAPRWRATYRLAVPPAGETTARLQGWAVLENATADDWNGVDVTLQSGQPVTFRQSLWAPAEASRPAPPPPGGRPMARAALAAAAPPPGAPPPMAPPAAPADITAGIAATRFELPAPVSLAVGEVASLPFLDARVPAESLDLLDPDQPHPLAAVRLTNATQAGLPGGGVATFDGDAFVGDARLAPLPRGEPRVLTFAEDLAVGAVWSRESSQNVTALTVSGGVAHLTRTQRATTRVTLTGAADEPRTVLLGIPRLDGATLTWTGATPSDSTPGEWRARVALAPGERHEVIATADTPIGETVALTNNPDALLSLQGLNLLSPDARAAVAHIAELRREQAGHEAERARLLGQQQAIVADEQRLRENLAAVPPSDPLHARLLRDLDAAETRLDALAADADRAATAARQAGDALRAAIAALAIGG